MAQPDIKGVCTMITCTTAGFSRVVDFETGSYGNVQSASLPSKRQDTKGVFTHHHTWRAKRSSSPRFASFNAPGSPVTLLTQGRADLEIELKNGSDFVERLIFTVDRGVGKTSYVLAVFQTSGRIGPIFFSGGGAGKDLMLMSDGQVIGDQTFHTAMAITGLECVKGGLAGDVAQGLGTLLAITAADLIL